MLEFTRQEAMAELKRRYAEKAKNPSGFLSEDFKQKFMPSSRLPIHEPREAYEGGGLQEPWIDPASVFAAGAGSGVRAGLQAGKGLVSAGLQGLRSGLAGAVMDYPVGMAAETVGKKYPAMALPVSVGLGIASGKYIEPKLEAGLRKIPEYAAEVAPYSKMKMAEQRGSFSMKPVEEVEYKPFYSQLENVIESKVQTQKPVDPEAFKQVLKPGHGIKQDELTNTKIKDFLEGKKVISEKVSKNDVLDYLKEQRTELKDVVLGGYAPPKIQGVYLQNKETGKWEVFDNIEEDAPPVAIFDTMQEADKAVRQQELPKTQFSTYQEPGGTNYREMFVTAPEPEVNQKVIGEQRMALYDKWQANQIDTDTYQSQDFMLREKQFPAKTQKGWQDGHPQYKDIQNPVIRVRFNERTDDAGRKILFIEEMQGPSKENAAKMPEWLQKRQYDMGVKRILKYAADNGFDGISWTPGSAQADRYDLSKQIGNLKWVKLPDGDIGLWATGLKGEDVAGFRSGMRVKPTELESTIGKEIAQKIIQAKNNKGEYSGLDLKVGGEGLKSLYDKILPKKFQEITKGKVVETRVGIGRGDAMQYAQAEVHKSKLGDWLVVVKQPGDKDWTYYSGVKSKEQGDIIAKQLTQGDSVPFISVPKEAKKGYPLYAAIPAIGLAAQEKDESPQFSKEEALAELKRRKLLK